MRDLHHAVLDAADALGATVDHADYVATAAAVMGRLLAADHVFWSSTDLVQQRTMVAGDAAVAVHAGVLGRLVATHPGVASYGRRPGDLTPRRVSDVCSLQEWRRSAVFAEVFRPLAADRQLSLMTELRPPTVGVGWVLTRSRTDFDAHDLQVARALHPLLRMTERLHTGTRAVPVTTGGLVGPTPRERQVLALLDQGLTAAAIARRCDVTTRAVRKHLEHLYAKLGCSDRLLAVHRARELGWLPPLRP